MIWALMTLGVYLFHEKMKPVHWMFLGVLTVGVYAATMTRTTFLVMAATLVLAFLMDKSSKSAKAALFISAEWQRLRRALSSPCTQRIFPTGMN